MSNLKTYWNYAKTIFKHKKYVLHECKNCGIIWQGITHDLSKFSKDEFVASALYYDYNNIKRTDEILKEYIKAWCHHKGRNKHHWEYWTDFGSDGKIIPIKIPYNYIVEMICDWIGAGKTYEKDEWDQTRPLAYYNKVRQGRHFHSDTEHLILKFLVCIKNNGLDEFYKMAKNPYSRIDYEEKYLP